MWLNKWYINKPAAAIALVNSGIPVNHRGFWISNSPEQISGTT